jgi:signal peptidase I
MSDYRDTQESHTGDGDMPSPSSVRGDSELEVPPMTRMERRAAIRARTTGTISFGRGLIETVALIGMAWVLAFGIKTYIVQPFLIPSSSMEPTLAISDRVLVNKFVYRFTDPSPGDIVVFVSSEDGSTDLIKRVIAVGGQTVDIQDGAVIVDGRALDEPFVNKAYPDHYDADAAVTVPPGTVWVMGDNRANSKDSRYIGPQPISMILGRAFAIYWPLERLGWL